jgi:hypothetical protein
MATLPKDHPLHKPVNWKRTRTTKKHRGPLQILANTLGADTKAMEKIPSTGRNPSKTGELPFRISIPADKEASAREAENATEEIQVFTRPTRNESTLCDFIRLYAAHQGPDQIVSMEANVWQKSCCYLMSYDLGLMVDS